MDQVALEGGQHLLRCHVHGADHGQPRDHEPVGRQQIGQGGGVEEGGADPFERIGRQGRHLPPRAHVDEAGEELQLEVPLEAVGGHGEHEREVERQLEPVHPLEDDGPGLENVHGHRGALVDVDAAVEPAVRAQQVALEGGGGVDVPHLERHEGGDVDELVHGRREHRGHHRVHQGPVACDHAEVLDRAQELGRPAQPFPDLPAHRPVDRLVAPDELLPEVGQGFEAQLRGERQTRPVLGEGGPDVRRGVDWLAHVRPRAWDVS